MVRSDGAMITEDNILSAPRIADIAKHIIASDHVFFEYQRNGETMLLSIRDIPELNWRVLVEQRGTNALAAIRSSLITNSLVGLAVTALTLAIIVYTVNLFYARLETMATTDKLTGIFNRSMFDISVIDALKYQIRDRKRFSIIMLDIDHFKRVNDTHGHLEGDRAFRSIAHLMRKAVRDNDILCRRGGRGVSRPCPEL